MVTTVTVVTVDGGGRPGDTVVSCRWCSDVQWCVALWSVVVMQRRNKTKKKKRLRSKNDTFTKSGGMTVHTGYLALSVLADFDT
jgi:hypothetical protein